MRRFGSDRAERGRGKIAETSAGESIKEDKGSDGREDPALGNGGGAE